MRNAESILETIGNTPLLKIRNFNEGSKARIFAKMELMNPGGSIKDRIGFSMIEDAEKKGLLQPGGVIVEATSGNTGIGLALAARVKGYGAVLVVTDKVSREKCDYLRALGAKVVSVPCEEGYPDNYFNAAKRIAAQTPKSVYLDQYTNPANPETHYRTTGPEIWEQTEGRITHFVAAIGTGGTISGVGKYLKEKNPEIKIIGADPEGSILKDTFYKKSDIRYKPYLVEAIGQNFVPKNVCFDYIDEIISVSDVDSFAAARALLRREGILCGASTGTIFHAALQLSKRLDEKALIVFIVCDTGCRYLTKFHNDEWLWKNLNYKDTGQKETAAI